MNREDFRELLTKVGYDEDRTNRAESDVEEFQDFLQQPTPPRALEEANLDDVRAYARHLIEAGRSERARFVALYHYADLISNHEMMKGEIDL